MEINFLDPSPPPTTTTTAAATITTTAAASPASLSPPHYCQPGRHQHSFALNTVAPAIVQQSAASGSQQKPHHQFDQQLLLPRIGGIQQQQPTTTTTTVTEPAAPMDYGYFGNKDNNNGMKKPVEMVAGGNRAATSISHENPWSGAFTKTFIRGAGIGSLCAGGNCGDMEASQQQRTSSMDRPYSLLNKLSAEFVGTMLFVFVGSMSRVYANPQENSVIHAAFAHGLAIFVLIASFGHISGGHFNPAVTLGVALSGKLHAAVAPLYWIAQLIGGLCAALLVRVVLNQNQYDSIAGGATIVPSAQNWQQALITEALLTAFLVQTVLTTAVDTAHNVLAPLAIGMTVALDIFAGGSISGASMNPARSFGPAVTASMFLHKGPGHRLTDPIWSLHFVYWAGPFLGSALAAMLYRSLLARGHNRLIP